MGEVGWITGQPVSLDVVASEDSRVLIWTREALDALFGEVPELRAHFNIAVAKDLAGKLAPT